MIGLGLSLCGACVMADNDAVTEKPVYTREHTRGYFVARAISIHPTPTVAWLYSTALRGVAPADVEQRGVCSSKEVGVIVPFLIHYNGNKICRQTWHEPYGGFIWWETQNASTNFAWAGKMIGQRDVTWQNANLLWKITPADGVERSYAADVQEDYRTDNPLYIRALITRHDTPSDCAYHLGYTKVEGGLIQLVYPLACVCPGGNFASIELIDETIIEH